MRQGLNEMAVVVAVAAQQSFRKAAAELGMSPSSVSHAVSALEQRLGVRLFNRTTRSVALSEAGEQFLARVRPALDEIAQAVAGIGDLRDTPSGTIRINASEGAAAMVLAPLLLEFLRRYPEMQVDLVTEGRLVDIVADGFDAGIRTADLVPRDMIAVPCSAPVRFALVGSPAYFARHGRPRHPGELQNHSGIRCRLPGGVLYDWEFVRAGERIDFTPEGRLTLDNHHLMIRAALDGFGLAWVDAFSVADLVAAGRLVEVLEDWAQALPPLCLYYPSHRHLPAGMRAFVAMLREANAVRDRAY
ncbi:LysR family transcriptional regulator [Massilia sp. KIM]|uniref:LysR family transcriptional regulator n=1 Tax=Massilia sp. KIM TaxID=1955422 RepID=UPI00098F9F37|nr:LysR family transcriptional regulator [Massilia sp. KIM]OON59385.1 LysR family transcriptional regulator [Massilia sp. KIM]